MNLSQKHKYLEDISKNLRRISKALIITKVIKTEGMCKIPDNYSEKSMPSMNSSK